jgi:2-oxoglutarate ferredoxin oxidoreductase subunit delta
LEATRKPLSPEHNLKIIEVEIDTIPERCKGCGICVELCPKDVLEYDTKLNMHGAHPPRVAKIENCVGCGLCEEVCGDLAIFLRKKEEQK